METMVVRDQLWDSKIARTVGMTNFPVTYEGVVRLAQLQTEHLRMVSWTAELAIAAMHDKTKLGRMLGATVSDDVPNQPVRDHVLPSKVIELQSEPSRGVWSGIITNPPFLSWDIKKPHYPRLCALAIMRPPRGVCNCNGKQACKPSSGLQCYSRQSSSANRDRFARSRASHDGVATIYLGALLPVCSSDLPECVTGRHMCTPIRSCSRWGLPSQPVSRLLVRSYRTVASLPVRGGASTTGHRRSPCLWHYP